MLTLVRNGSTQQKSWLFSNHLITLSVLSPGEERKLPSISIFTLFCGVSKGFMKA